MNKCLLVLGCLLFSSITLRAQTTGLNRQKVAVFAPLYLDSAFSSDNQYKHGNNFPRYIIPGLEFYQGVQLALDSMQQEGVPLEVFIYDTKSISKPFSRQLAELPNVELIIGATNAEETPQLANLALSRKTPFISATLPNDAGVKENPYFVILNSTIPVHITELYKHLQKNNQLHPILYFSRKSKQDDWLKTLFTGTIATIPGASLKIKFVELGNDFTAESLTSYLDSTTTNVCIVGSMDETFSKQLAAALATDNKVYPSKLFGMPTWENYKDLAKPEFKDLEISYTVPLYSSRADKVSVSITDLYKRKFFSRPSDMVFWGYGAMWRFGHLLLEYGPDFPSSLSTNKFGVFTTMDIQPVLNPQTQTLDYFENKKVYLITKLNGAIISAR